jgi:hypothetical protein
MLKIPSYVKAIARKGLLVRSQLPKSQRFGIDEQEALRLGIDSGVRRAKQLISNDYLPSRDIIRTARFYARFHNRTSFKIEGAFALWGGRRWCRYCYSLVYGNR